MAKPAQKRQPRKGHGHMQDSPDLLAATVRMDLEAIESILEAFPESIGQLDEVDNNAMHLCVAGGAFRVRPIMEFFVGLTGIDLLHKNNAGYCPLELAIALNDEEAIDLLEGPTHQQLNEAYPEQGPDIQPV